MHVKWLNCGPQNMTTITPLALKEVTSMDNQGLSKAPRQNKYLRIAIYIFMSHVCLLYKYWITFFRFTRLASFPNKFPRSQKSAEWAFSPQISIKLENRVNFWETGPNSHYKIFFLNNSKRHEKEKVLKVVLDKHHSTSFCIKKKEHISLPLFYSLITPNL